MSPVGQQGVHRNCLQNRDVLSTLEQHYVAMEQRHVSIQQSILSKRVLDSKNSAESDSILLFVEKLYLGNPYDKIFTSSLSQWFNKKCCQDWGGCQGVSFFIQKAKSNTRDNEWQACPQSKNMRWGRRWVTGSFSFGITKA